MRRHHRSSSYRPGDFYRIDDLSGKKVHASDTVKLWNGLIVSRSWFEARNPQDFVRARHDHQMVPEPRPEESDSFLGPLQTVIATAPDGDNLAHAPMGTLGMFALGQNEESFYAANLSGSFVIEVATTAGMSAFDRISIILDNGEAFPTYIFSVSGSTTLVLIEALTANASAGNPVTDFTAATTPSIG